MTYTELKRMTLSGHYGDLAYDGNDLVMPILDGIAGDQIGIVTFESEPDDDTPLEDVDANSLIVKSFDF